MSMNNSDIEKLIEKYVANGGEVITIEEGCLGYGITALVEPTGRLKQFIITEVYLNEWSSDNVVIAYAKRGLPKKYETKLEELGFYRGIDYR